MNSLLFSEDKLLHLIFRDCGYFYQTQFEVLCSFG